METFEPFQLLKYTIITNIYITLNIVINTWCILVAVVQWHVFSLKSIFMY